MSKFKCPVEGFNSDETDCCHEVGTQYCCKKSTKISSNTYIFILICCIFSIIIGLILFVKCRINSTRTHETVSTVVN